MRIQEFDFSVNLLQAILWQYNDAVNLQSLLQQKQDWYNVNQQEFWQDWYTNVFNLVTANDFGLAVWSIILNIPLSIDPTPDPPNKPIFGFGSNTLTPNSYTNFINGNFSIGNSPIGLTLEEKRLILRLRYYQLTSRTAIPEVNAFLKIVFASFGNVYLLDGLNMTISCIFNFTPSTKLLFILKTYDLIPRAAGVRIRYLVGVNAIFGFGSSTLTPNTYKNFTNGCLSEVV